MLSLPVLQNPLTKTVDKLRSGQGEEQSLGIVLTLALP